MSAYVGVSSAADVPACVGSVPDVPAYVSASSSADVPVYVASVRDVPAYVRTVSSAGPTLAESVRASGTDVGFERGVRDEQK